MRRLLGLIAVLATGSAVAGDVYNGASCYSNADGSGACYGSFLGFRNDSYSSDEVNFINDSSGPYFQAEYGNNYYACTPVGSVATVWPSAMSAHGYFYMSWNSSAQCTYLSVYNTSFAN